MRGYSGSPSAEIVLSVQVVYLSGTHCKPPGDFNVHSTAKRHRKTSVAGREAGNRNSANLHVRQVGADAVLSEERMSKRLVASFALKYDRTKKVAIRACLGGQASDAELCKRVSDLRAYRDRRVVVSTEIRLDSKKASRIELRRRVPTVRAGVHAKASGRARPSSEQGVARSVERRACYSFGVDVQIRIAAEHLGLWHILLAEGRKDRAQDKIDADVAHRIPFP